jgi:hypothetical protein
MTMVVTNADLDWNTFNSDWYSDHNYRTLRDDDQQILELVRDYFSRSSVRNASGIDVGTGPNLYPALSLLPFCSSVDLWEHSTANVRWLEAQVPDFSTQWQPFWNVLAQAPVYAELDDPRAALRARTTVKQASVFDLPARQWSLGTMFFVACSLSGAVAEFERAVTSFVRALTYGAPFAAAFMAGSSGYDVDTQRFPAVCINETDVRRCLASLAYDVTVYPITTQSPVRDGYLQMLLATGKSATAPATT